jgi:serpin B
VTLMRGHRRTTLVRAALVAGVVTISATGCGPTASQEVRGNAPAADDDEAAARRATRSLNAFAVDLERTLAAEGGNLVVASYPLALSLAMARAGAHGDTREQLDVLLAGDAHDDLDAGLATLSRHLHRRSGDHRTDLRRGRVQLSFTAALWTNEETSYPTAFLDRLSAHFDTGVRTVDFRSDPEAAREAMNRWVAEETHDRISQLVARGAIRQYTRFVLTSAGYLQAPWKIRFDPALTRPAEFRRLDGTVVAAPTMRSRERVAYSYAEGDGWEAVELPYLGDELAMLVIAPSLHQFADFESELDDARMLEIARSLRPRAIDLQLPQFQFTTELNLNLQLVALGLESAFDTHAADFSGITTDENLTVSEVITQTFIGVDEEGTDGEAATVVPRSPASDFAAKPVRIDRPFLFVVRDIATGLVLQIGRVVDPTS